MLGGKKVGVRNGEKKVDGGNRWRNERRGVMGGVMLLGKRG